MTVFFFTLGVFAVAFLLFSIRILLVKDGEFHGTCSSQGQALENSDVECGVCVKKENDLCPSEDESGLTAITQLHDPNRKRDLKIS